MARPAVLESSRTAAFNLTDRMIEWIHEQAATRGISKSAVVREALESAVSAPDDDQDEERKAA